MIGLGFSRSKVGRAGLCLLALATASGGVYMQRELQPVEEAEIENSNSFLGKKEIALGRAEHRKAVLVCPPPTPPKKQRTQAALPARGERPTSGILQGMASWYGGSDGLHGALTASGEPFDEGSLTAAHRTLPFGTRVRVTFLKTGKSVVVRINDRGPFAEGRIIDISRAAAAEIGLEIHGTGKVTVEVLR